MNGATVATLIALALALVLASVAAPIARAADASAAEQLAALLEPVQRLTADFTQTVRDARGEVLQSAEGNVCIARPDQFKWVLKSPYPQTIVTVGDRLYVYDPDLKQVQIKPLAQALTGTPALVLLGTSAQIAAQFNVTRADVDGSEQFDLKPKNPEAVYTQIRMTFGARRLIRIEIVDSLGQLTDVSFHGLEINKPLAADAFRFVIPPDADVIGDVAPKPA